MKTLKLGALALGMMVAGSAVAYPGQATLAKLAKGVFGTCTRMIKKNGALVDASTVIELPTDKIVNVYEGGIPVVRILRHQYPVTTLVVVAAITAGVIAYKKYSAKKKKIEVEETEDNIEEITAE